MEPTTKLPPHMTASGSGTYTESSGQRLYGRSLPQGAVILNVPHNTALRRFKQLQKYVYFGAACVNGLNAACSHPI